MKIKYFAWIKERLGKSDETLEFNDIALKELLNALSLVNSSYHDVFTRPEKFCIVVNDRLVTAGELARTIIASNDEVSFFPPISGG